MDEKKIPKKYNWEKGLLSSVKWKKWEKKIKKNWTQSSSFRREFQDLFYETSLKKKNHKFKVFIKWND